MSELKDKTSDKEGIGGWLVFVLLGLIVTPIRIGITLFTDFFPMVNDEFLMSIYPSLKAVIYTELIGNISFIIFAIVLLILMLLKDRRFPKLMIIFYITNTIFVVGDAIYVSEVLDLEVLSGDDSSLKEIARAVIGTFIWVPYLLMSTRVRLTFTK